MSYLKFSNQLFLEKQELDRLWFFIEKDGWLGHLTRGMYEPGLVYEAQDVNFNAWKVVPGTLASTIAINRDSHAWTLNGQRIYFRSQDNIAVPTENDWYWIKISYAETTLEEGTVNIDANGNMTGTSTRFEDVLRGQPNFPSKIKFSGSTANVNEYQVVEVIDDTTAILAGNYSAETDLKYAVVGTFTPGYNPPTVDQFCFRYDSCNLTFVLEQNPESQPQTLIAGNEYWIARCRSVAGVLEIQDYRNNLYKEKAEYTATIIDQTANPLIGVEQVTYDGPQSTLTENLVKVGWGMRSENHTYDSTARVLTINSGAGGKFKSTTDFTDGDFDGWLVYTDDFVIEEGSQSKGGRPARVISSSIVGSNINLLLDILNPLLNTYTNGTKVTIVPDAENIEIAITGPTQTGPPVLLPVKQLDRTHSFPILDGVAQIPVLVPVAATTTYDINIKYRLKRMNAYSEWRNFPSDTVNGYYDESSFGANGIINPQPQDRNQVTYTDPTTLGDPDIGYITLTANANNYVAFQNSVTTGDAFGSETITMSNGSPVQNLIVGTTKQVIYVTGTITLTTNHIFNLSPTGALPGNQFTIIFDANITTGGWGVSVNDNWVNSGTPGTVLHYMTPTDYDYMKMPRRNVVLQCTYVSGSWIPELIEYSPNTLGEVKMFGAEVDMTANVNFDGTGLGVSDEYLGWALCNGQNGTVNLRGKFVAGSDYQPGDYAMQATGGSNDVTLTANQSGIQSHYHALGGATGTFSGTTNSAGAHEHSYSYDANHDGNGGNQYHVQATTSGTNTNGAALNSAGSHTHTVSGSVTLSSGNTGAWQEDAQESHENRPSYVALGYCQRIPYGGGAGGPGGTITYPEPTF